MALAFLLAAPTQALDRHSTILQLHHTAWTLKDGAPDNVAAIAQTADGTLWLGTPSGLIRFDGIRFQKFEPIGPARLMADSIFSLVAEPGGGLWVGYTWGGLSLIQHGQVRNFDVIRDLGTKGAILQMALAPDGSVWAIVRKSLLHYADGRWAVQPTTFVGEGVTFRHVLVDRAGDVVLSLTKGVYVRMHGETSFERVPIDGLVSAEIAEAPDGRVWVSDAMNKRGVRPILLARQTAGPVDRWWPSSARAVAPVFDRDGVLWSGAEPGIQRVLLPKVAGPDEIAAPRVEGFDTDSGFSGDFVHASFEDREGNLWFGTSAGLDRFRMNRLQPVELPKRSTRLAVVTDAFGGARIAAWNQGLFDVTDQVRLMPEEELHQVTSMLQSREGPLYLGGARGLFRYDGGKSEQVPFPAGTSMFDTEVQAIAEDASGGIWVSARIADVPLFRIDHGSWTAFGGIAAMPKDIPQVMFLDNQGAMWFGYARNKIARLQGRTVTVFGPDEGYAMGYTAALSARHGRLWVAGERGLFGFDGHRFRPVMATRADALNGSSGLAETASGDVWLNTNQGIVHLRKQDLDRAWNSPDFRMPFEHFDWLDGLPGNAEQVRPVPTAAIDTRGRIWFVQTNGAVVVDPDDIHRNGVVPNVILESVKAGGTFFREQKRLDLPSGTSDLQFDYTATSLAVPERVTFRYRLDGLDKGWQDAGTRRQAFYTHLGPGRYRFSVMATNEDGVSSVTDAAVDIDLAPAFYQTRWFLALIVALVLGLAWLAYRARLQQMDTRLRASVKARQSERERIASELHDTLLQNVQGLILVFQSAAARTARDVPGVAVLNRALDDAERVLVQGRRQLSSMRTSIGADLRLGHALKEAAEEFSALGSARFTVSVSRDEARLRPEVVEACYWTAREAMFNAARHADASVVQVTIECDRSGVFLRVSDNGRGIPAERRSGSPGHLGIPIMSARAGAHGGKFEIKSVEGQGTAVEMWVPPSAAFKPRGLFERIVGAIMDRFAFRSPRPSP